MIYFSTLPLVLLLFVVFQHSVVPAFFLNSIKVEISLIMILYAGFRLELIRGVVLVLLLEVYAGLHIRCFFRILFSHLFYNFLLGIYDRSPSLWGEPGDLSSFLTALGGCLEGLLMIIFNLLIYGTHDFYSTYRFFLPQLIVVSIVSPVFFKFFDRFGLYHGGFARSAKRG